MCVQKSGIGKTAIFLCIMMLFSLFPLSSLALASAPLTSGQTQNGMVRVYLSSLGNPAALNLTISGSYSVNGVTALADGAKLTLKFNSASGSMLLSYGGATTNMGSSFALRRHEGNKSGGVKIAQGRAPSNLYPADLSFVVKKSGNIHKLYVIALVFMEDYLYGVLPYEMGNASGLEALKAQAVAARTYTMRAMQAASGGFYDLVDTTADQVYSGTPSGNANCRAAVDATKGIVAMNGSSFTATYYTASNGGQTESIQNAWGTGSAYAYLKVKDDPYDRENPDSRKISFSVRSSGAQSSAVLQRLLDQKAASVYGSGAEVTKVTAITPHTPKYAPPSRLYTKLDFSIQYRLNGKENQGKITFHIFNELEGPLSMSINAGSNELWDVTSTGSGFTVTARRFGHGLGMSQRGAMYMAKLGYSYDQILAFYFEGCKRVQYQLTRSILSPLVSGQSSHEQLTVEAPAPVEEHAAGMSSAAQARVTTSSGSLNLRSFASSGAAVMLTIPKNALIPILEKGNDWCKTSYNGKIGYVMSTFLTFLENEPTVPAETQMPDDVSITGDWMAKVTTASGSLNLRAGMSSNAKVLCTIPQNAVIRVSVKGDSWSKTAYNGQTGYVMSKFLTYMDAPESVPAPSLPEIPSGSLAAWVNTPSGSLNLRFSAADTARVLCTIPQYAKVTVLDRGDAWCKTSYNGQTGYVMTKFLSFDKDLLESAALSEEMKAQGSQIAYVATASGSLNLRKSANDHAAVLSTIPQYAAVTVLQQGSNWTNVQYESFSGYVMTRFLSFTPIEMPASVHQPEHSAASEQQTRMGLVTTASGSLNLRRQANNQAAILCTIPQNAAVPVLQQGSNWCQVVYEGKTGYVITKFLTILPTSASEKQENTSSSLPASLTARISDTASTLNLRTGPSTNDGILLEMPAGAKVNVLENGDSWCLVAYQGAIGYCAREYLEIINDE